MENKIRVAVFGASGRMGALVCEAVDAASDMTLVARVGRQTPRDAALDAHVVIDFTNADAALANIEWALDNQKRIVVGATGIEATAIHSLQSQMQGTTGSSVLLIPNFSIGAFLARKFSEVAGEYFTSVELIEYYHAGKGDGPSGTSVEIARGLAKSKAGSGNPISTQSRRGEIVSGIHVHSIRLPGFVSRGDVIFGREGEILKLSFETGARSAYMEGVLEAVRVSLHLEGLHEGFEAVFHPPLGGAVLAERM